MAHAAPRTCALAGPATPASPFMPATLQPQPMAADLVLAPICAMLSNNHGISSAEYEVPSFSLESLWGPLSTSDPCGLGFFQHAECVSRRRQRHVSTAGVCFTLS